MSSLRHQKYLERNALKAAQKALDRGHSRESLHRLRIQTVEPWKRLLAGGLSFASGAGAWWCHATDKTGGAVFLGLLSMFLLLIALFGFKRTIEGTLNSIDILTLLEGILD